MIPPDVENVEVLPGTDIPIYIFGVMNAKELREDIPKLVIRELHKRRLKHGLPAA